MDWGFETSRCKLLYTEWVKNKVLLYTTGDCIQDPIINHNGYLNHFGVFQKLAHNCKSTIFQLEKKKIHFESMLQSIFRHKLIRNICMILTKTEKRYFFRTSFRVYVGSLFCNHVLP